MMQQPLLHHPTYIPSSFVILNDVQNLTLERHKLNHLSAYDECRRIVDEFWNNCSNNTINNVSTVVSSSSSSVQSFSLSSLPHRIHVLWGRIDKLVQSVHDNNSNHTPAHQVQPHSTSIISNTLLRTNIITTITAMIQVQYPSKVLYDQFMKHIESMFITSIVYHTTINHHTHETTVVEQQQHELYHTIFHHTSTNHSNNDQLNQNEYQFYDILYKLHWISNIRSLVVSQQRTNHIIVTSSSSSTPPSVQYLLHDNFMKALQIVIMQTIQYIIDDHSSSNNFSDENDDKLSIYESIMDWTNQLLLPYLYQYICCHSDDDDNDLVCSNNNNMSVHYHTNDISSQMNIVQSFVCTIVTQCYWSIRIQNIFDIITSFPESLSDVQEIQQLLYVLYSSNNNTINNVNFDTSSIHVMNHDQYRYHQELADILRDSLMGRLNHPGATTTQVIDLYIATIQVLDTILFDSRIENMNNDNKGTLNQNNYHFNHTLIDYITEPVRSYLRYHRNDTVRCIVASLTQQSNPSLATTEQQHVLYQELRRQDIKPLDYMTMGSSSGILNSNSDDEDYDDEVCPSMDWQPRPSIFSNTHHQRQQQQLRGYHRSSSTSSSSGYPSNDILAMLVSIYGSKELFVNEYRSMLSDRLLSNTQYNTDQDVHTLELLKLRFGEMSLINAEVMIKDIEDSARINKNIHDSLVTKKRSQTEITPITSVTPSIVVDAAIVSHIFWPKLQNDTYKHHPRIQNLLDEYAKIYAEQKNPRILHWLYHLGTMTLDIDVVNEHCDIDSNALSTTIETKEFTCTPFLATLISHFEDEPIWTADQLSNETNVPDHVVIKQMSFWIANHVVRLHNITSSVQTNNINSDSSKMVYILATKADSTNYKDHLKQQQT